MRTLLSACIFILLSSVINAQSSITGAWKVSSDSTDMVYVIQDDYLVFSSFHEQSKTFDVTWGGALKTGDKKLTLHIEFNSQNPDVVGRVIEYDYRFENGNLLLSTGGQETKLSRIDEGKGELAGNWRISGRMQNDKMNVINPGPRKTLKILSGTRFQWIAINTETKEFFGTGGGSYTFKDGKYTENIEFFSRDNSRVGASLVFDGTVENGVWIHKGKTSKGDALHEEWRRSK